MKTKNTYPPTYTRALLTSSIAPATRRRVTLLILLLVLSLCVAH